MISATDSRASFGKSIALVVGGVDGLVEMGLLSWFSDVSLEAELMMGAIF